MSDSLCNRLYGGAGNDTMYGSYYSDTYLFNLGDGVDTIYEYNNGQTNTDILRFGEGIRPEDVWFKRSYSLHKPHLPIAC